MGVFLDRDPEPTDDWDLISSSFRSKFDSSCVVDEEHSIFKGDRVAMVRPKDQPMSPFRGAACTGCATLLLKKRKAARG